MRLRVDTAELLGRYHAAKASLAFWAGMAIGVGLAVGFYSLFAG